MIRYVAWVVVLASIECFDGATIAAGPPTEAEIKSLVAKLVSANPDPRQRLGSGVVIVKYPPGYKEALQQPVRAAFSDLRSLGAVAFPYLIALLDDDRYSFREDAGDEYRAWSVGDACYTVLCTQLMAYCNYARASKGRPGESSDPLARRPRPSYCNTLELYDQRKAEAWWIARQHKSLRELQREALEWTIAEEAKTPQDFTDEERTYLQEVLAKLKNGDQPLPPYFPFSR